MMGPSDLNRIPRWMPQRIPDSLRRYARSELGEDEVRVRAPTPATTWLASIRDRFTARATVRSAEPKPLGAGLGAVHLAGEMHPRTSPVSGQASSFPSVALALPTPSKDADSDTRCTCEL